MIKQIKYFQAVVRCQSFTRAAEESFISQSAISQQIQSLEKDLGVQLMKRERRKISLTPAGEFFYRKSLVLVNDFDRLISETTKLANGAAQELSVGYLRHNRGLELQKTLSEFSDKFPEISLRLVTGTHEELYDYLRTRKIDMAVSDLRREPSDQYVNFFLARGYFFAELPAKNPLAQLEFLTADDLKNTPMILIAPPHQEQVEENFFREYFGVKSEFIFAENLQEAHLLVASNKGYFLAEFQQSPPSSESLRYIPIIQKGKQLHRKYFAFWRKDTLKKYLGDFAEILQRHFPEENISAEENFL